MLKMINNVLHRMMPMKWCVACCVACCGLMSCSDMDSYFEVPDWISGSIYEELKDEGNYTIFLEGIDRAGFKPIVDGKSILTVAAPTDDAMREYLQETYGHQDLSRLTDEEVKKLIGFHIMYYSMKKSDFINFRPLEGDGATEEEMMKNAGLYYKFRTKSSDAITEETDTAGKKVKVYHLERYMPVFSYEMFNTKGIDAKSNYEYFYPKTGWQDVKGFNIANAGVTEYEKIAKNGYIYKVDRVVKPLETIYKELQKGGEGDGGYSTFLQLYNKYQYYEADDALTLEYGNGDSLYQHYHEAPLANIACEWPVTNYQDVEKLAFQSYSVFAPTNKAFNDFFNDYWGQGGYNDISEVAASSVKKLLFNCVCNSSIVFPEEIEKGLIEDPDGNVITFPTSDVPQESRIMCSNGVLYGCNYLTPPASFGSVTGPAYQHKDYRDFLYFIQNGSLDAVLSNQNVKFIVFYPSNMLVEGAGMKWDEATSSVTDAAGKAIGGSVARAYAYAHTSAPEDENTVVPTSGKKVYPTMTEHLYIYIKDGKVTNSIRHNNLLEFANNADAQTEVWSGFTPLAYRGNVDGWTNGHCYSYDGSLMEGSFDNVNNKNIVTIMCNNRNDATADFFGFAKLVELAGQIDNSKATFKFYNENCFMFIPTTEAIEQAIMDEKIPGVEFDGDANVGDEDFFAHCTCPKDAEDEDSMTPQEILTDYLMRYFVPLSTAVMTNYPYVGWGEDTESEGGLQTMQSRQVENPATGDIDLVYTCVNVYDNGTSMSVGLKGSSKRIKISDKYDSFPFTFNDGGVHFIEGLLE
ncbi:MAG: fasciclin domain-containing protein [Prevotellaceae bacterium]|nr:fasciclin domain-containing protein [Prevotellaceae bacterium]